MDQTLPLPILGSNKDGEFQFRYVKTVPYSVMHDGASRGTASLALAFQGTLGPGPALPSHRVL